MRWDIFCRVIDNFGDIGVCWRLARQLGSRGETVRLCVDDASALNWMAPSGAAGVTVVPWPAGAGDFGEPGDVVVEAFGCELPTGFVATMAGLPRPPAWINLEYLSAEGYAVRAHGLPSPQSAGPGTGLDKWFYYPGFGPDSGGLIREDGLMAEWAAFDRAGWLSAHQVASPGDATVVSLFCYEDAPLAALLQLLSSRPTRLLLTAGVATRLARSITDWPPTVRPVWLPWLQQPAFDQLLWSADLNLVRGEDSLVRALWAGAPFVWQIYRQADGAHIPKLNAFLDQYLAEADAQLAAQVRALWHTWNGLRAGPCAWPSLPDWHAHTLRWRDRLLRQSDLCTRLQAFVAEKR